MSKTTSTSAKRGSARRRTAANKEKAATVTTKPAAAGARTANARTTARKPDGPQRAQEPLKPGKLDGLVLAYLKSNAHSTPHGPSGIAKTLGRSSGAVANCLVRLARDERVVEVSERPRRYRLPA